ncbi:hypothetical protein QR685DRAFT_567845 [Neurospora intermedia]|uniref:Questionable protein n=1 Tax=Neurospora intermedia TaxID=5142 RepID=A0ABR3DQN5_NEUIN
MTPLNLLVGKDITTNTFLQALKVVTSPAFKGHSLGTLLNFHRRYVCLNVRIYGISVTISHNFHRSPTSPDVKLENNKHHRTKYGPPALVPSALDKRPTQAQLAEPSLAPLRQRHSSFED